MVALCETTRIFLPGYSRTNLIRTGRAARRDGQAALSTWRSKSVRIFFPFGCFFRKFFFHFASRHPFPVTVRNFPQAITRLHFEAMRRSQNFRRFKRATERRRVYRSDLLAI
jgi:hypothetical protein